MTALAGFWRFDHGSDPREACARMLKAQALYGRRSAQWHDAGHDRGRDGGIALGRQLFPILPEDAHDRGPEVARGGSLVLVADARLDNRDELAEALGLDRAALARLSDAGLMLRALERWDEAAVGRFLGDFAFALWDGRRRRLLLARDWHGHRPLHLHRGAGFFAFASMPKGLLALPEVPRAVDRERALELLALMPEPESASFFEGIERVPPGHWLAVERGEMRSERWWHPPEEPLRLPRADDYAEALLERLDAAVAVRLRGAEGRIGAQLSAGLDSSAVATSAARLLAPGGGRMLAFTSVPRAGYDGAVPRDRLGDEGPLAAAIAALHENVEHVLVHTDYAVMLDTAERYFALTDRAPINLAAHTWGFALNDAAKARGIRVMLHGQAGNMTLSYAGTELLPELLGRGRLVRLASEALALRRRGVRPARIASRALGPFFPPGLWRALNRARGRRADLADYSAINPQAVEAHDLRARAAARGLDFGYRPWRDGRACRLWMLASVDLGNFNKAMLGGWGLDYRDPTADRRLVEFCLAVPTEQFHADGEPRALARRALAGRLPAAVLGERRRGLQGVDWHEGLVASRARVREEIERFADLPEAVAALDTARLRQLAAELPDGGWDDPSVTDRYLLALVRGVAMGTFLRRTSGSNR